MPDSPHDYPMNPFWFVPMDDKPPPRLGLDEWGIYDPETGQVSQKRLLTGRIRVRIRTLTPLHVCGYVDATPGRKMELRRFYRRPHPSGPVRPVVEGSSIRGMIRAYVEALTNGTVSVYNRGFEGSGVYKKAYGERHIGFWVGPEPTRPEAGKSAAWSAFHGTHQAASGVRNDHGDQSQTYVKDQPAHVWQPGRLATSAKGRLTWDADHKLDPSLVLFGLVTLDADDSKKKKGTLEPPVRRKKGASTTTHDQEGGAGPRHALAGRLTFEDAWFEEASIARQDSLDLDDKAAMGGPKPNMSNWWYFKPDHFRTRHGRLPNGAPLKTVEFVGGQLRGRKFYFHQDPNRCVDWYMDTWGKWQPRLTRVPTEVVTTGSESDAFHVYFRELPESLVKLLLVALAPSAGVRHKLGALRPFGFGSVEFVVESVELRAEGPESLDLTAGPGWTESAALTSFGQPQGDADQDQQERELSLAHRKGAWLTNEVAWSWLRLIAHWPVAGVTGPETTHRLFAYPPYRQPPRGTRLHPLERGFAFPVEPSTLNRVTPTDTEAAIKTMWPTKRAIDLNWYQMNAWNYEKVRADSERR